MFVLTINYLSRKCVWMLNIPVGHYCAKQRQANAWSKHASNKLQDPTHAPLRIVPYNIAP